MIVFTAVADPGSRRCYPNDRGGLGPRVCRSAQLFARAAPARIARAKGGTSMSVTTKVAPRSRQVHCVVSSRSRCPPPCRMQRLAGSPPDSRRPPSGGLPDRNAPSLPPDRTGRQRHHLHRWRECRLSTQPACRRWRRVESRRSPPPTKQSIRHTLSCSSVVPSFCQMRWKSVCSNTRYGIALVS